MERSSFRSVPRPSVSRRRDFVDPYRHSYGAVVVSIRTATVREWPLFVCGCLSTRRNPKRSTKSESLYQRFLPINFPLTDSDHVSFSSYSTFRIPHAPFASSPPRAKKITKRTHCVALARSETPYPRQNLSEKRPPYLVLRPCFASACHVHASPSGCLTHACLGMVFRPIHAAPRPTPPSPPVATRATVASIAPCIRRKSCPPGARWLRGSWPKTPWSAANPKGLPTVDFRSAWPFQLSEPQGIGRHWRFVRHCRSSDDASQGPPRSPPGRPRRRVENRPGSGMLPSSVLEDGSHAHGGDGHGTREAGPSAV